MVAATWVGLHLRCHRLQSGSIAEAHRGKGLMAKLPAFARLLPVAGRIVEMDVWDKDFLDLVETAQSNSKARGRRKALRAHRGPSWKPTAAPQPGRPQRARRRRERIRAGPPVVDRVSVPPPAASPVHHLHSDDDRLRMRSHLTSSTAC